MENKVKKFGITLGFGTLAYWVIQKFRKSDGSFLGTVNEAGKDLKQGYRATRQTANRTLAALRAGAYNWRKNESKGMPFTSNLQQGDRGNGSTLPGHSVAPVLGLDSRGLMGSNKTI